MIFLDTNVVSELLRERPDPRVLAWSDGVEREAICTVSVVEAELRVGIEKRSDGRRKRAFGRELEAFLGAAFGGRVYPFGRAAARFYAESWPRERRQAGRSHRRTH